MTKIIGITSLLGEREKTHGSFPENANFSQQLKEMMRDTRNWGECSDEQREALEMVAVKLSRILTGDHNFPDHWKDVAGYSNLIVRSLEARVTAT